MTAAGHNLNRVGAKLSYDVQRNVIGDVVVARLSQAVPAPARDFAIGGPHASVARPSPDRLPPTPVEVHVGGAHGDSGRWNVLVGAPGRGIAVVAEAESSPIVVSPATEVPTNRHAAVVGAAYDISRRPEALWDLAGWTDIQYGLRLGERPLRGVVTLPQLPAIIVSPALHVSSDQPRAGMLGPGRDCRGAIQLLLLWVKDRRQVVARRVSRLTVHSVPPAVHEPGSVQRARERFPERQAHHGGTVGVAEVHGFGRFVLRVGLSVIVTELRV